MFSTLLVSAFLALPTLGGTVAFDGQVTRITGGTSASEPISIPKRADAPPNFNITSLGLNGSGCPPKSAFYLLNNDKTAVTITFSAFEASAGPDIAVTENRKNCQLSLGVRVPHGFSFAIVDVDYRGFYSLDDKVKASHSAAYYFQGQLVQAGAGSELAGPLDGKNYVYRDEFNLSPTIYSPCGEDTILNINSEVRVDNSANKDGYGYIVDDSIDASVTQTYNFQWLTCP
ncbi:hypothetical protein AAF712_007005 [Marasmius tenuissimus]|uniref:Secreted protein n=1 Tax=Marasmius tenuissimus TaxID=585030 RepID=A0ABR2ZWF9_9AGAR